MEAASEALTSWNGSKLVQMRKISATGNKEGTILGFGTWDA